jgi:hypothetical protein
MIRGSMKIDIIGISTNIEVIAKESLCGNANGWSSFTEKADGGS